MSETCMPDGQWSLPARHKASPFWAQAEKRKSESEAEAEVRMPKRQPCLGREPVPNV